MKTKRNQHRDNISNNLICKRIKTISQKNNLSGNVQDILVNLFDYMMTKKILGGCHSLSSALYVALCEIGENPKLCIGECYNVKIKPFDHSWILLNGKVIDMAIYMQMNITSTVSGVVIMDIDTTTQEKCCTQYGYETGLGFGLEAQYLLNTPFVEYMDSFPYEKKGLWTLVEKILPEEYTFDINVARKKYANVKRMIVKDANEN